MRFFIFYSKGKCKKNPSPSSFENVQNGFWWNREDGMVNAYDQSKISRWLTKEIANGHDADELKRLLFLVAVLNSKLRDFDHLERTICELTAIVKDKKFARLICPIKFKIVCKEFLPRVSKHRRT